MITLILLLLVMLSLHHWLIEPWLVWGSAALELTALPWVLLLVAGWLLAGRQSKQT